MAKDQKAGAPAGDKKGAKGAGAKKGAGGATAKKDYYAIEGGKLERKRRSCPKCGPGVFLAEHKDRSTCGKCGYTEFKGKKQ